MSDMIALDKLLTPQDFYEAVDRLHTAAIDNLGERQAHGGFAPPLPDRATPVLRALEAAMEKLLEIDGVRA